MFLWPTLYNVVGTGLKLLQEPDTQRKGLAGCHPKLWLIDLERDFHSLKAPRMKQLFLYLQQVLLRSGLCTYSDIMPQREKNTKDVGKVSPT